MAVLNPKKFAERYIDGVNFKDLAPNGLDLRVHKLYKVSNLDVAVVCEKDRRFLSRTLVEPQANPEVPGQLTYRLEPDSVYEFESDLKINIPMDASGFILQRSSLLRNGVQVSSGWYDSNFSGGLNGFIFVHAGPVIIGEHERVAQLIMLESTPHKPYDGIYQGTSGTVGTSSATTI